MLWLLLLVGAVLIVLQLIGIPGDWAAGILRAFEKRGVYLDAERISLDVRRGVVVHACRLYDEPSRRVPLLQAESVAFRLDHWAWLRGRLRLREASIQGGRLRFGSTLPGPPRPSVAFEQLEGRLLFGSADIDVVRLSAQFLGSNVSGKGRIDLRAMGKATPGKEGDGFELREVAGLLDDAPRWMTVMVDQLGRVQFADPPDIALGFVLRPGLKDGSLVRLRGRAGRTTVRGLTFDTWAFDGALRGAQVTCRRAMARAGDQQLLASGSYHLETRMAQAHLDSNLSPIYLEGLMPIGWRDRMDETGMFFGGPVHMTVGLGPEVPERLLDSFTGQVSMVQAELRDVWVERAEVDFSLKRDDLDVPRFTARIGRGARQGPVSGTFSMNLETKEVKGTLASGFDWAEILPMISGGAARAIRLMRFEEKPPRTTVEFAGRPGGPEGFFLNGQLEGESFMYRGAYVNRFRSNICLTNHVLTLGDFLAQRDEGRAEGTVAIDFKAKRVDLDLYTNADPQVAARTGGDTVSRIVNRFRFEGPAEASITGSVYFGTSGLTDLRAHASGRNMGLKWFMADEASFDFRLLGREALVTNFVCTAYGGEGEGVVRVYPDGERWRFAADLKARDMAFGDVTKLALHRDGPPHPGSLAMNGRFDGLLGEDFLHSLKGEGDVRVGEAQLLQVPLFFGLSRGLSRIYPGLGFATQTDFSASFEVKDQRVYTDDARLEGTVLGLSADGSYGLADKDLYFKVEVRLLREQGVASSLVHLVTSPLSKLLQFDLRGTLEEPRWRPNNLPKELFLMFD